MSSAAAEQRDRSVAELYNATELIGELQITSVLQGSFHMQGPVDKTDHNTQKNMVSSQSEKRYGKRSMNRKGRMKVESGTCNVCSAPCSSCMHLNLAHMGSKTEEFSDETCRGTVASQHSVNAGKVKSRACESLQHTGSEASNFLGVNSSHDSFSENAESKATVRSSDISDASKDVEMLPKLSSGKIGAVDQLSPKLEHVSEQEKFANEFEDSKGEGRDDNISCVSRASDANVAVSSSKRNVDNKVLSCTASFHSLGPEGSVKALVSQKLDLSQNHSKDVDDSNSSPNMRSPKFHSESGRHLIGGGSEVSMKVHPKSEADADKDGREHPDEGFKSSDQVEQDEKSNELDELPEMQEPPTQAESGNESDESDIVEHDVKVCDICGDAGREDLLAICNRCSDGAEHTYCMREMLQKVPEGDWLCEECKFVEESESQRQGSDAEEKRTSKGSSSTQSSGKRRAESVEVASSAKRQAIEASLGSPKSSSPTRVTALSRDSSFKSLDKGKIRLAHQISSGNQSGSETSESARSPTVGPRLQTPKGTLTKSNSFSTLNSKPKVKLVDEVLPQKLKGTRENSLKEGPTRVVGKSMSFKSPNSGLSNSSESKSTILPSKYPRVQDLKGLKTMKDRNPFERKTLSKLDRSLTCSAIASSTASTPSTDQKLTPRGEINSLSHTSNNRESKVWQSDGKSSTLTKSNSIVARKGVDIPVTSVGASSANGVCSSTEQKLNQASPKEEPLSSSALAADKPPSNVNGLAQDGVPRLLESINQSERTKDCSVSRSKSTISTGLKGVPCQKCKEIGHAAEHCPVGGLQTSVRDASAARTSRDEINKSNNLKAAIEAAMQKKPGMFAKNKAPDQPDGLLSVELNCEKSSQDQSFSNKMKTMVLGEGTYEGQVNPQCSASDSHKQPAINHAKQLNAHAADLFRVWESDSNVSSVGKPMVKDQPGYSSAVLSSAIPEHEYIWQGTFEVCRGGKLDLCAGIQAHLSIGASPKVLEVVNKFSYKIPLMEVPRLSSWPAQFHSSGAKEDNIALYFFAKDIESYEKNYKGLLDNMIKSDLALKGNFEGVELLIFPSILLPDNCQRWNMLYFLWGVCRARKVNSSNSSNSRGVSSFSQNSSSAQHVDKESSFGDNSSNTAIVSNVPDRTCVAINGDCGDKVSLLEETTLGPQGNSEHEDNMNEPKFLSNIAPSNEQMYPETRRPSPPEEVGLPESKMGTGVKPFLEATGTSSGSHSADKRQMHGDVLLVRVDPSPFKRVAISNHEVGVVGSVVKEKMSDRTIIDRDQQKEINLKVEDGFTDIETVSEKDLVKKELNPLQVGQQKRPHLDLREPALQTCDGFTEKVPLNDLNYVFVDDDSVSKKLKSDFSETHGCSSSRDTNFSDCFATRVKDVGSSSSAEVKLRDKACDEKVIPEDLGTTERYFFPVESHHVKDFGIVDKSVNWKRHLSEDGNRLQDGIPNLELALGAETKPLSNMGILPALGDETKPLPNKGILPALGAEMKPPPSKGILPFLVGVGDKDSNQNRQPDALTDEKEEDVSAALSLSLSFPFPPDKEQTVKPVSRTEQILPERRPLNTSLFLFGDFLNK